MKRFAQLSLNLALFLMMRDVVVSLSRSPRLPWPMISSRDPSSNDMVPFIVDSQPYSVHGTIDTSVRLYDNRAIWPVRSVSEVLTGLLDELEDQIGSGAEIVAGAFNDYFYQYIKVSISWFMQGGTVPFNDCLHVLIDIRNHFLLQDVDHPISATVFEGLDVKMYIMMSSVDLTPAHIQAGNMIVTAQKYPSRLLPEGEIKSVFGEFETNANRRLSRYVSPGSEENYDSPSGFLILEMGFHENEPAPYPPFKYVELRSLMREVLRQFQSTRQWCAMGGKIYYHYEDEDIVVGDMHVWELARLGNSNSPTGQHPAITEFRGTSNNVAAEVQTS